jgi:hypothetical protein
MRSYVLRPVLRLPGVDLSTRRLQAAPSPPLLHAPTDVQTQTVAAVKQGSGLHAAPSQSYKALGCLLTHNRAAC